VSLEILVEGEGLADVEILLIAEGASAQEVVSGVAAKGAFADAEAVLFVEDGDEPLDLATTVVDEAFRGRVHHVHRLRRVTAVVSYKEQQIERQFSPSTRVQRVLDWAVGRGGFNIDPSIAPEMELALQGTEKALPKSAHIGRFAHHPHHELKLDLIRGVVPNGARH
jgi:hypothetical protein